MKTIDDLAAALADADAAVQAISNARAAAEAADPDEPHGRYWDGVQRAARSVAWHAADMLRARRLDDLALAEADADATAMAAESREEAAFAAADDAARQHAAALGCEDADWIRVLAGFRTMMAGFHAAARQEAKAARALARRAAERLNDARREKWRP